MSGCVYASFPIFLLKLCLWLFSFSLPLNDGLFGTEYVDDTLSWGLTPIQAHDYPSAPGKQASMYDMKLDQAKTEILRFTEKLLLKHLLPNNLMLPSDAEHALWRLPVKS